MLGTIMYGVGLRRLLVKTRADGGAQRLWSCSELRKPVVDDVIGQFPPLAARPGFCVLSACYKCMYDIYIKVYY